MKQETLKEAAKREYPEKRGLISKDILSIIKQEAFINGAKWQRERSYSEENMRRAYCRGYGAIVRSSLNDCFYEWFEQFKNK